MSNRRAGAKPPRKQTEDVQVRFEKASALLHASVHRHVEYSDSSADEEADSSDTIQNIWKKRMKAELRKETPNYIGNSSSSDDNEDAVLSKESVSKSMYHIEQLRCSSCLICLSSIKAKHPIWSCLQCYTIFHLPCIQKWAKDSTEQHAISNDSPLPGQAALTVVKPEKIEWDCPKCRLSYKKEDIPQKNYCFCKKVVDPESSWLLPHCCGGICEKPLEPSCGHKCLLTCHPGPCPPCPRLIQTSCHCSRSAKRTVRCSVKLWQCDNTCGRLLACSLHKCTSQCHVGDCPPCTLLVPKACVCGSQVVQAECGAKEWQCDKVCKKPLACEYHECGKRCHAAGDCEKCPLSGEASCPCGGTRSQVQCPEQAPLCGGTCNKALSCGEHRCSHKCHRGPCPPCPVLTSKACRCGTHTRSLPCSKEYICESKCRRRPCGRHPCSKRCCVDCGPCGRPCGKALACSRHKCQAECHRGPCYPCVLQNKLSCRCGDTYVLVNCGQKNVKPPSCVKRCREKYTCGHHDMPENSHKCHFGECPPCRTICEKPLKDCQHTCKAQCHRLVKLVCNPIEAPATPVEVQTPKVRKVQLECPPCNAPVVVRCPGGHEESSLPCHRALALPCGRPCGARLPCGNHTCQKMCHAPQSSDNATACETCESGCTFPRPPHCKHSCPLEVCHPDPCPPCNVLTQLPCHCTLNTVYLRCKELSVAPPERYSCGARCVKNMDCGHQCRLECHAAPCLSGNDCKKKIKLYCPCRNNKIETSCHLARSGEVTVYCNELCAEKKNAAEEKKKREDLQREKIEEEKQQQELEEYNRKFKKRPKEKSFTPADVGRKKNSSFFKIALGLTSFIVIAAVAVTLIWPDYMGNNKSQ